MQHRNRYSFAFLAAISALLVPIAVQSADAPASQVISITATRTIGAQAVTIAGDAPAGGSLDAALYARFSQDLPTVLLSRHSIVTDANGHYNATLTTASGFFRNAIVTVVVTSPAAGSSARASIIIGPPNVPAPPDDIPSSVR
jgi:hypothetical protein